MKNTCLFTYLGYFLIVWILFSVSGFAQEPSTNFDVAILESRFSTISPVVGDTVKYFLKFDHVPGVQVQPMEYFTENGLKVLERKQLAAQEFQGRIIEQYEYTLQAETPGEYHLSPVTIEYQGPRQNPVAAVVEPVQLNILPVVEVQVVTNSPLMLGESLELSLSVTKRKPVTISALPDELEAEFQEERPTSAPSQKGKAEPTPDPSLRQAQGTDSESVESQDTGQEGKADVSLRFTLDQTQNIAPQQQQDGATVEQYRYLLAAPPERAGEYFIPQFEVTYRGTTGDEQQFETEPASIFVLNPNTQNLEIETDYRYFIPPAIVAGAGLLGGLAVFLFLKYRKLHSRAMIVLEPQLSPGEVAHKELAEIQAMQLPSKGEFKTYYFLLSETVRKFLGAEFHFPVLERTTEEILRDIQRRDIPEPITRQISTFLPEADMVKFAKYLPTYQEADEAMAQARLIVNDSLAYHQTQETQKSELRSSEPVEGQKSI